MKKKIRHDSKFIQVFEPTINFKDKVSVLGALNKKYISGTSPIIKKFEENLEEKFNVKKAVTVTNGSEALDIIGFNWEVDPRASSKLEAK